MEPHIPGCQGTAYRRATAPLVVPPVEASGVAVSY